MFYDSQLVSNISTPPAAPDDAVASSSLAGCDLHDFTHLVGLAASGMSALSNSEASLSLLDSESVGMFTTFTSQDSECYDVSFTLDPHGYAGEQSTLTQPAAYTNACQSVEEMQLGTVVPFEASNIIELLGLNNTCMSLYP